MQRTGAPEVVPVTRVIDALQEVGLRSYEAAICVVDGPDELACVIRLKKAKPDLPVLMLTKSADPIFRNLGEQMGADAVVRRASAVEKTADLVATAMESRRLAGATRKAIAVTAELVRDIQRLSEKNRKLVESAMGLAASVQDGDFVTLVVDDEPSDLLLLVQALRRAGLPPFIRTAKGVPQAREYLSGGGIYKDRAAYPVPSLIISDLNLGGDRGTELLRWVRSEPLLSHLGFILFTSSEREEDIQEAARHNANFYIPKSARPDTLVSVVRSVYEHARRYKTL